MASITEGKRKDGSRYYEIKVSRGRGKSPYSTRWDIPKDKSKKTIDRELNKFVRDFEKECEAGNIQTREEQKQARLEAQRQAEQIKTVKQYAESIFLANKEITRAINTVEYYRGVLARHVFPMLADKKLDEVTSADIERIILSMQKEGLSWSYVRGAYITCNQLFKMAYKSDMIPSNPCDKIDPPRRRKGETKKKAEAFTKEELIAIIEYLEHEPLKWRLFVQLLIETGVRKGEALGLKWKAIDLEKKEITIENNLCYTEKKGVYETTPKSNKVRVIPISDQMAELLKAQRKAQLSSGYVPQYCFTQEDSTEPMDPGSPGTYLTKLGRALGIDDCHAHKFRHTFATQAIINGADIASVSEILGHSEKSTTLNMYTHADAEAQKRACEIFRNSIYQDIVSQ